MRGFLIMIYRQVKRFFRARSKVLGAVINPLIMLTFFGLGSSKLFDNPMLKTVFGGFDYLTFLTPGMISLMIFTGGFAGGISVIWDKEFGFLKETLVAPSSGRSIILGGIFGDSLNTLFQAVIIMLIAMVFGAKLNFMGIPLTIMILFLLAMTVSSIGVSMALKISNIEGFQTIIMILMLPTTFLSGAFNPINTMPEWMRYITYINPLTYGVDISRFLLLGSSASNFPFYVDVLLLALIAAIFPTLASLLYEKA